MFPDASRARNVVDDERAMDMIYALALGVIITRNADAMT